MTIASRLSSISRPRGTADFSTIVRGARTALALIGLFAVWEGACRYLSVPNYVLPAPSSVVADLWEQMPNLVSHTLVTWNEAFGGFLIAIAVGIPLAMIISFSPLARDIIYPAIVVSQMIPKVVLAPLFIIWFGIGLLPKFLLGFLLCFFPIVLS